LASVGEINPETAQPHAAPIASPLRQMPAVLAEILSGAQPAYHLDVMGLRTDIIKPKECRNLVVALTINNFAAIGKNA
jgi:hypothetical protein